MRGALLAINLIRCVHLGDNNIVNTRSQHLIRFKHRGGVRGFLRCSTTPPARGEASIALATMARSLPMLMGRGLNDHELRVLSLVISYKALCPGIIWYKGSVVHIGHPEFLRQTKDIKSACVHWLRSFAITES